MADSSAKVEKNVAGPWYVDENCIACGLCSEIADTIFVLDLDEGYAYVTKQPVGDDEIKGSTEAMEQCPTEAIGNDG